METRQAAGFSRWLITLLLLAALVATAACRHEETSALALLERAEALQAAGDYQGSIEPLQHLVVRRPRHATARRMLAEAYLDMGEAEAALSHIRRAIKAGAHPRELLPSRARALVLLERYDDVVDALAAVDTANAGPQLLIPLAKAYLGRKDLDASEAVFRQILEFGGDGEAAHSGLFEVAMLRSDHATAESHLAALPPTSPATWRLEGRLALARDQAPRAERAYRRLLTEDARDLDALTGLAQAHLAAEDYAAARELLESVHEMHPESLDGLYLMAVTAYLQGDHDQALRHVRNTLSKAPHHGSALRLFGLLKLRLGHYEQAVVSLKAYLAGTPQDMETRKLLAALLLQLNHPWEAETVLRGVSGAEDDATVTTLRGLSQLQRGNYGAAIELLQRAVDQPVNDPGDLLKDPVVEAGDTASTPSGVGDIGPRVPVEMPAVVDGGGETAELVQRILHEPDDTAAYMDLAARAEEEGDLAEACALYARAVTAGAHPAAGSRFRDLQCEPRYGTAEDLAARTPFRGEPAPATARADVEREMARLLAGLRSHAENAADGHGLAPSDATPLSRTLAERVTTEQLAAFDHGAGNGRRGSPLYRLPPELKERLKAMRDSLPAWLRRLNDQPDKRRPTLDTAPFPPPAEPPPRAMAAPMATVDPMGSGASTASAGTVKWLMDLYDGAVGFLAWTSRMARDYQAVVFLLVTPVLMVLLFLGVDSTRRHTAGRRPARRTEPPSLQKRAIPASTRHKPPRTSSHRRSGRRRRRRYVPG